MTNYVQAQAIQRIQGGHEYFQTLHELIGQCTDTLHFQTYIFEADATGLKVIEALLQAAQRKVKVYLLLDAFGSMSFPKSQIERLVAHGIHIRFFAPLGSSQNSKMFRRLHHKVIVCDRKKALIGGINIADKYKGGTLSEPIPWLDFAVLVEGGITAGLDELCAGLYEKRKINYPSFISTPETPLAPNQPRLRYRRNDWIKGKNEIRHSYIEAIIQAEKSVCIIASYFLPGPKLRRLLTQAAKRGVEVTLLLGAKSDIQSERLAESYLYDFFLRNNIKIYEWTASVLHGKAMLCDSNFTCIGSYNLNYLSHYLSVELNLDILDSRFTTEFQHYVQHQLIPRCNKVESTSLSSKNNPFLQLLKWASYGLYRALKMLIKPGKKAIE